MKIIILLLCLFTVLIHGQYTTLVTNTGDPTIYTNEPSAASNGDFVAVGCNYNSSTINKVGYFYSTNNGTSWTQGDIPKGYSGNSMDDSDPSLAFDAVGNLYYAYISSLSDVASGIFVNRSTNNGQSWLSYQVISIASSIGWVDKPYIYIKNISGASSKIFVSYTAHNQSAGSYEIKLAYNNTEDLGEIGFSYASIRTVFSNDRVNSAIPHCTSDGKLYVTFIENDDFHQKFFIKVARSDNDGTSFQTPVTVREYLNISHIGFYLVGSYYYGQDGYYNKKFRVNGFPTITSINNKIYIAWCEKVDNKDKIIIKSSTDYGNNWNIENMDPYSFNHQFFPWLSRTIDNKLCLVYHSSEDIPLVQDPLIYTCVYVFNPANGTSESELVDEFNFRESFTSVSSNPFIGDYINIAAFSNDKINFVFTSNADIGSAKPTVIKCASIPNKVNIELQSYQNSNLAANPVSVSINGTQNIEPAGEDILHYTNAFTYKDINFNPQDELSSFNYRHRNSSNEPSNIGNPFTENYEISSNPEQLNLRYFSVLPLTISSNFEGAQNVGSYDLTWTTGTNIKETKNYSTTPYRAFDNTLTFDLYNIEASSPPNYDNTTWQFSHWNDLTTVPTKTDIAVTSSTPNEYIAYYKGIQRSNNANTYDNNSQRKFIRSKGGELSDGYFHSVYSSMGKVWYESKSPSGQWELMNGGKPITNIEAKNPTIVFLEDGFVLIAYQVNNSGNSAIDAVVYNYYLDQIVGVPYNVDFSLLHSYSQENPVAVEFYDGRPTHSSYILFVYKNNTETWMHGPGLVYNYSNYNHSTKEIVNLSYGDVTGTNINFSNPSLASCEKKDYYFSNKMLYLAYQEDDIVNGLSRIWYQTVDPRVSTSINHANSTDMSLYSGYTKNYKPNLITLPIYDQHSRLTWIGERTTKYFDDVTEQITSVTEKKAIFRGSSGSLFWNFGNDVRASVVQKSDANYFLSWNQFDNVSKAMNNTSFTTIRTINTNGQQIEVCNGIGNDDNFGVVLRNTDLPYKLEMTNNLSSYFGTAKETSTGIYTGREGTVTKNNSCFYYTIGDINVNGLNINFKEITDSTILLSNQEVKSYLETEPFELNNNSTFNYSIQYGYSFIEENTLVGEKFINFKVKLIDVNSNTIISTFDNVFYTSSDAQPYSSMQYTVNTNGIGNKTVKLVLDIDDNIEAIYSISTKINDTDILNKSIVKNIDINGIENISSYDISQNYPNPFNPSTTIRYQIPKDGMVTLKIYDILGREVKTLVNNFKTKGRYEVMFDAINLSSGLYIYEIKSGEYKASKKMTLIK